MIPKQIASNWNSSIASPIWLSKKVLVATIFFNRGIAVLISSSSVEPEMSCDQANADPARIISEDFVDWGVALKSGFGPTRSWKASLAITSLSGRFSGRGADWRLAGPARASASGGQKLTKSVASSHKKGCFILEHLMSQAGSVRKFKAKTPARKELWVS